MSLFKIINQVGVYTPQSKPLFPLPLPLPPTKFRSKMKKSKIKKLGKRLVIHAASKV
jgi:hypothetical protein